jgi:nicotinamide mononucleotide (NMN) deamidase PncC
VSYADLATPIHASGRQLVIAVTGGGGEAISALVGTPGASRSVLEAIVPYSSCALAEWLGSAPEQACSGATARAMAMAAWFRARQLAPQTGAAQLVGVGCTASLATDRPKRGDHRVHVSTQTIGATAEYSLELEKGIRDRAAEESLAATLVLKALSAACGVVGADGVESLAGMGAGGRVHFDRAEATADWAELLLGARRTVVLHAGSLNEHFRVGEEPPLPVIFSGAFNPPHVGHLRMAAVAEQRLGQSVAWELSIANVEKPPLDFIAIRDRLAALRLKDDVRPAALTFAPTFREKAELFPGSVFVVGADTALRIGDPRFYGDDVTQRDEAIGQIAACGCRFLVFGRQHGERFQTLSDLDLPAALRALCDGVSAAEFREDVSSTELRARSGV